MKYEAKNSLLHRLRSEYEAAGAIGTEAIWSIADDFGLSYGEIAGKASFYSLVNGLPAEERLKPVLKKEGPIIIHARENSWAGLAKAQEAPENIIDEIELSGLSGRGGAAFPTGRKWRAVKQAQSSEKYVICNVSEGEPGTAKDLYLLSNFPLAIIEGMAICALAVGAKKGIVYIRAGYEDAAEALRKTIDAVSEKLNGFEIELVENLGAYVCGEETALISSLEVHRGEPAKKPPYPTERGLMSCPTVINNAESFAAVPLIIDIGAERYRENETRLFTVTGCGAKAAVCEMPLSVTVQDIFQAAGCAGSAKAFQLGGGASGAIFPAEYMSFSLSSSEAKAKGIRSGAGSLRFISEDENLRDICAEIMRFYADESCGKCTPCRYGCKKLCSMLRTESDIDELKSLAEYISASAFCALGKSVGNAILSAIKHFPEDFGNNGSKEEWI